MRFRIKVDDTYISDPEPIDNIVYVEWINNAYEITYWSDTIVEQSTELFDDTLNELFVGDTVSWDEYYFGDNLIPSGEGKIAFENGSFIIDHLDAPELCVEAVSNYNIRKVV